MSDAISDVPEDINPAGTSSGDVTGNVAETVIEHPTDADVTVEVNPSESTQEPPAPIESEPAVTVTDEPLSANEESAVIETSEEPVTVAADSSPAEEVKSDVEPGKVERRPDTRPKRKLGWRAFILGGSGGTR